ncbi:bifunctional DedA family/phosphatase PAP2 family protein [Geopsychrobacter electrodiphilus]|uniref:bifunctional DedA family/phosphatase PAP2 family protein n=1 Tax=Geopsychrobacter electrodiphilus TaxID=225196 RepID=UPI0003652ADA|nr:bifunctional DedA family/phosphatase PAP2 family protein [Geopsychrobacter electrodiphilus]
MDWSHLWHNLLQWVSLYPLATYLAIFLISLSESLALVGLLVPGTVMMVGIGALAGSGAISLKITLLAAMAGAISGDGLSYWLGHHYHQGIKELWPFRKHPQLLQRGEEFFHKHGGKSVLFGRFVGPVRPVIPVIAGMLDMPVRRFLLVNILSAIGWAFAYILPGVILGSSLTLVGAVSTRLSLLLLMLGLLLWLTFWLTRKGFERLGRLGAKGERLLPLLCIALLLAVWLFAGVLEDLITFDPLVQADQAIYHWLQSLRSPWGDQFFVALTELGDALVLFPLVLTVLAVLLFHRRFRDVWYWLAAVAGGVGLVQLFKWTLHRPRPIDIYSGVSSWGFPSGHSTMSVVFYGFLALLLARSFAPRWRWTPFGAAIGVSLLIALSRIYLGAHWLSDVVGGMALGWSWVILLGIFYLRGAKTSVPMRPVLLSVLLMLLLAGVGHINQRHASDLLRYRAQEPLQILESADWQNQGFRQLPTWRYTLLGDMEQPLTLQLAGDPQYLARALFRHGWQPAPGLTARQLLNLFVSDIPVAQLPLLPRLSNGRREILRLVKYVPPSRMVLRLWPTSFQLKNGEPLWAGTVEHETAQPLANLLTLPLGKKDFGASLQTLAGDLEQQNMLNMSWAQVPPPLPADAVGKILLLKTPAGSGVEMVK